MHVELQVHSDVALFQGELNNSEKNGFCSAAFEYIALIVDLFIYAYFKNLALQYLL